MKEWSFLLFYLYYLLLLPAVLPTTAFGKGLLSIRKLLALSLSPYCTVLCTPTTSTTSFTAISAAATIYHFICMIIEVVSTEICVSKREDGWRPDLGVGAYVVGVKHLWNLCSIYIL